jgi:hypothetical protein
VARGEDQHIRGINISRVLAVNVSITVTVPAKPQSVVGMTIDVVFVSNCSHCCDIYEEYLKVLNYYGNTRVTCTNEV